MSVLLKTKNLSMCAAGGVCPTVDPHVLPVPRCSLLHYLVCPLSSLHWHHRGAATNSYHHGDQLDDHCRAPPHFWGELQICPLVYIWDHRLWRKDQDGAVCLYLMCTTCLFRSSWCTSWTVTTVWAMCVCSFHSGSLCSHSWPQHLARKGEITVSI